MELAIDTSTAYAGIALSKEGVIIADLVWFVGQNHTVELVPGIMQMLDRAKVNSKSLNALFVAKGPGSFNGLRVGISTVKGFAFALDIPVVAVGTLEIEAYPFGFTRLPICAIHNAGRGEIAVAMYRQDDRWQCIEEEHITDPNSLTQKIKEQTLFCGEIPPDVILQLRQCLGNLAIIPSSVIRIRRTCYLAELGWQRLSTGYSDNLESLQPIYLRQPPITQRKVK